jgi:hypothetical protein
MCRGAFSRGGAKGTCRTPSPSPNPPPFTCPASWPNGLASPSHHLLTHLLTHSPTHPLAVSFTHSPSHPPTQDNTHPHVTLSSPPAPLKDALPALYPPSSFFDPPYRLDPCNPSVSSTDTAHTSRHGLPSLRLPGQPRRPRPRCPNPPRRRLYPTRTLPLADPKCPPWIQPPSLRQQAQRQARVARRPHRPP